MHLLTLWMFATCFKSSAYSGRSARDCCKVGGGCFCLDALLGIAAWTLVCHCCLISFSFCCFLACWWGFGVCSWICRQSEAFFIAPPLGERVPHCGIDVLCGYMCGVCRLCADILCPLRLLWLLYPVHWGSALPIPGGHLAVLCWHGIILRLWARSVDPDRSPRRDLLCPQRSGLCGHGLFVSWCFNKFSQLCVFFFKSLELLLFYWLTDFPLWLSQHQILPVRDLWSGIIFLPLWYPAAGWGFLHNKCCQADLRRVQEHPVRPLPQPDGERMGRGGGSNEIKREGKMWRAVAVEMLNPGLFWLRSAMKCSLFL